MSNQSISPTPKTDQTTSDKGLDGAACSAVSTPTEELAHLKEVVRNNGYDSITDAIVMAKRYMDEIKRLRRVLHDIADSRPDEYMDVEKTPELVKWICETCRNASVGAYPPNAKRMHPLPGSTRRDEDEGCSHEDHAKKMRVAGCHGASCSLKVFVRGAGVEGSRFEGFQSECKIVSPPELRYPET